MWNEPEAMVRPELAKGERLLWSGRPDTISFGSAILWFALTEIFSSAHALTAPSFDVVDDSRSVFKLVREAQRSAQKSGVTQ